MCDFLKQAGFTDIKIQVKENGREIISGWMPGSGAEKYVTSAYVTATKPSNGNGLRDDVRVSLGSTTVELVADPNSQQPAVGC
jgi:hypothetical protein|mmetsp:Transcript_100448/g.158908  ORF Transcript_100448/g.158908 Transcript_100448/m.158908 type:complete len:83 (+) Transcript_100448:160-408(+)